MKPPEGLPDDEEDFFTGLSVFLDTLGRDYVVVMATTDGGSPVLLNRGDTPPADVLRAVLAKLDKQDVEKVGPGHEVMSDEARGER